MSAGTVRIARWIVRVLVGLALLLVVTAAGIWWWAGQEGSLEWTLRQAARGGLQSEGVHGSLRRGWHIARIVWERDGLRLEAEDIRLEWEPLALLDRTLQLRQVQVARARVIDRRPRSKEPLQPPKDLRLPWRVHVDRLAVGALSWQGAAPFEASGLVAQYAFDGLRHRVDLASLRVAGGAYRGEATLLATAPLTLDARIAGRLLAPVPGSERRVPLQLDVRAQGPASGIEASARLVAEGPADAGALPRATATARITPFAAMPVPRGAAEFEHLDLAMFWPAAPRTELSGHIEVVPLPGSSYRLAADLRNGLPGPWDRGRLPVSTATAQGTWRDGTALVESLAAQAGGGRVEGSGAWEGPGWKFEGRVAGVDPARLHTALASLPISGPVQLAGAGRAVDFDVALRAGPGASARGTGAVLAARALELREVVAQGRWEADAIALARLRLRTSDASLQGQLRWNLSAQAGSGKLQLRAPGLQAEAQGSIAPARGQGTAQLAARDLAVAQRWWARWPGIAPLLKDLALRGEARAQLAWQGGWRDPAVQAQANARGLGWQAAGPAGEPAWTVRTASLQWRGRLRDAALDVSGSLQQGQRELEVTARGTLGATLAGAASRWNGRVAALALQLRDPALSRGHWRLQLQQPVDWRAAGGNFEVGAGRALLRAPPLPGGGAAREAVLAWNPVRRQGGELFTSGRVGGLPLAWIELVAGPQLGGAALSGDMVFDARWTARLGRTLQVEASLVRTAGDVNVLAESIDGAAARVTAGVRDARLTLRGEGEQLVLSFTWDSERAGHAQGELRTRLARSAEGAWSWPAQAPLAGQVQAQLPRIGVWSLLAPPGWRLRGSLAADIRIAGTRAQPELSGPVDAEDLALRSVVDGIELRNGRLRARLAGQKLAIDEFLLHGSEEGGGGGTLLAFGEGSWTPAGAVFTAQAQLSQLRASIRSDRQLTVSGPVFARMDRAGTTVTGDLRVDRARIRIPDETPPRLGEDVVVRHAVGLPATEPERRQKPPPEGEGKLSLDIRFDLGPDFRVTGRGVDTRLAGSVQVQGDGSGAPQIVGLIRAVGGTYQAYGQRMEIERGELRFTGPADNPALDILAIRPNLQQKVGVLVTGRAQSPHVELYSEAGLSEAETLSYVVLGRSSAGGGADAALLQRAAAALLSGRSGTGKGIAGSLGLDDLSVSPDSTSGAVVRVGKRFADNFYAAYERSLSGAMGTLFIFFDLSRRATLRVEAGDRTGVDLIFTFAFDRVRK